MNTKYLVHHGIDGQKWGQRNGPPYPLDYDDHSAAEKRKNPKSELDNYTVVNNFRVDQRYGYGNAGSTVGDKLKNFAKEHKTALIIGGLIVTAKVVSSGRKHVEAKKNEYIDNIMPYWKSKMTTGDSASDKKFMKRLERDLSKMKMADLAKEAKNIAKNDWSTLNFDKGRWS